MRAGPFNQSGDKIRWSDIYRSAVGLITGSRPTMREMLVGLPIPRTFICGDRGGA
jgi:hypothetical protein